ncbi:MAG TPA: beta-ketoacyl synthase N-terminal-like domain-containing protein [Pseudonocardiaceae bacterium]
MRTVLDTIEVAASVATLPTGERARIQLGRSGPRGRGDHVDLPIFQRDPRQVAGVPSRLRRQIDRFSALAYVAVSELLDELPAGQRPPRERIGVFLANTRAGWSYGEPQLGLLVDGGPTPMHAYQATAWFPAAAQGEVTIGLDLRGSAKTAAGRISGFGEALWLGRDALERDAVDLAVVGAVESLANGFVLRDWASAEPLPSTGPAEGAVVFALRRTGSGRARLRDLRFGGTDDTDPGSGDWVPTLSAAARLHEALSGGSAGVTVSLGGGYAVTVDHPESDHPATDHTTTDHTEARRQP